MSVHCVLASAPAVKQLATELNLHPLIAATKIALWQETHGLEKFPVKSDLLPGTAEPRSVASQKFTRHRPLLNTLSQRFGIGYELDTTLSGIAEFRNGKVIVNPDKLEADTPFHEFSHPFEQVIRQQNRPLWKRLATRSAAFTYQGQSIEALVRDRYPELSGEDLQSEVIVTALGLAATDPDNFAENRSALQRFIDLFLNWTVRYLNELRKNKNREIVPGDLGAFTRLTDLAALLTLDNPVDLSGGVFTEARQKSSFTVPKGAQLEELRTQAKEILLDETDPKDTFYKKNGKKLQRVTEFIAASFSSKSKNEKLGRKTVPEWMADRYFKEKQVPVTEQVVWDATGGKVSYEEVVVLFEAVVQETNYKGKISHAIVEHFINPSFETEVKLKSLKAESGLEDRWFAYLTETYLNELLINKLGLNIRLQDMNSLVEDHVASEVVVGDEDLGLAGTIDMLVEHANDTFSIIDLKTGKLLSDITTPEDMNFSNLINDIVKDNKLNKAQMQVMMYAFLLKLGKPSARFTNLRVVHLQGKNVQDAGIYDVSIENYLQIIEGYFKNERPDQYARLKERGMFTYENYTSVSKETFATERLNEIFDGLDKTQRVDWLAGEIEKKRLIITKEKRNASPEEEDMLRKWTKMLVEARMENKREPHSDQLDMGQMKRWIGNLYEVAHPMVQSFIKLYQDRKLKAKKEYVDLKIKNDRLFKKVLDEYYRKNPGKKIGNALVGNSITYHNGEAGDGLYDFMWEYKTVNGATGWFGRTITAEDVAAGKFSPAQLEYNAWYRETTKGLYERTMRQEITRGVTKETLWGGDATLINDSFMPRIPKHRFEVIEKHGLLSKENLGQVLVNYTTAFLKESRLSRRDMGLPVKYMGSTSIITNELHSFDAQEALLKYAQAMINKQHLDPVEAVGSSTILYLKESTDLLTGQDKYKNLIAWTESFIKNQLTNDKEDLQAARKPIKFKLFGKEYALDYQGMIMGSNNFVSMSAMWLNVPGATFNALMNGLYTTAKVMQGSILKRFGLEYDYSFTDWLSAAKEYAKSGIFEPKFRDDKILANSQDKMHRFIELMDYDTNTFRNIIEKKNLLAAKNRLLDKGKLYMLHSLSEEFALYTTMISLLKNHKIQNGAGDWIRIEADGRHTKVGTKKEASSMWDAYEVTEAGDFVYKGPARGQLISGATLTGLSTEEIIRLRRVSSRIYGGYREDEKTALEGYLLGQLFMKFKKYLPNVLTFNFQGKFQDESLGKYVPYLEDGVPKIENGQTVYQWQAQINEGRVRLLGSWLQAVALYKFSSDPKYRNYLENLGPEQYKLFADAGVSVLLMFGLMAMSALAFDDEDKKKKWYKRFDRLHEDIVGINPFDLARTAKQGLIQFELMYKTMDASYKFFYKGLIMGEVNQSGKYKGEHPGSHFLKTKLPVINIANQFGLVDDEEEFFLNRR